MHFQFRNPDEHIYIKKIVIINYVFYFSFYTVKLYIQLLPEFSIHKMNYLHQHLFVIEIKFNFLYIQSVAPISTIFAF